MSHDPSVGELDLLEAGRLLGLGRKRLIKWAKADRIPHRREEFAWFFTHDNLLAFARQNCLECGTPHTAIEAGVYFCTACGSAHALDNTDVEVAFLGMMEQQRIALLCQRLSAQGLSDQDAIAAIRKRLSCTALRAYQIWFVHAYEMEGTLRVGLGSTDSPFEEEQEP